MLRTSYSIAQGAEASRPIELASPLHPYALPYPIGPSIWSYNPSPRLPHVKKVKSALRSFFFTGFFFSAWLDLLDQSLQATTGHYVVPQPL